MKKLVMFSKELEVVWADGIAPCSTVWGTSTRDEENQDQLINAKWESNDTR